MTDRIDEFESLFRSASKERFHYHPLSVRSVLVVTDLQAEPAGMFAADVRAFAKALDERGDVTWTTITGDRFTTPKDLLDLVEDQRPDLVVTYRCLHSAAWQWVFTLGAHLDVLTQATTTPVLVLPHPEQGGAEAAALGGGAAPGQTDRVMAVTDHLAGDERLVNAALAFAEPGGTLYLSHVEDDSVFERYIDAIGKIPDLDTTTARELLQAQLLKEPHDYVGSCREALEAAQVGVVVQEIVTMGHRVKQYIALVEQHEIDLLVLNTKDEGHSAMHGLAYALAVELRQTPLLML